MQNVTMISQLAFKAFARTEAYRDACCSYNLLLNQGSFKPSTSYAFEQVNGEWMVALWTDDNHDSRELVTVREFIGRAGKENIDKLYGKWVP